MKNKFNNYSVIPHVPSACHPVPELTSTLLLDLNALTEINQSLYLQFPHSVPPPITEDFARRPESIVATRPHAPSGPGDLAFEDAERARQEAFQHHQQRWEDLTRNAEDAEERREQYFREHEEERDRIFADNENRRDLEAQQRRDEVIRSLEDRMTIQLAPPAPITPRPPSGIQLLQAKAYSS